MKNLLCLLLFMGCSVVGFGRDSIFTIEGRLYDGEMSKPIRKSKIYLIQNKNKIDSTFSNWRGIYRFKKLKAGCYSVVTTPYQMLVENDKICFENGGRKKIYHSYYQLNSIYGLFSLKDSSNTFKLKIQDNNGNLMEDFEYKIISTNHFQPIGIFEKIDSNKYKLVKILRCNNMIEATETSVRLQEQYSKDKFEIILYNEKIPFTISPIELTLYQYVYYQISIKVNGYEPYEEVIKIKANQTNFEYIIKLKKTD